MPQNSGWAAERAEEAAKLKILISRRGGITL